MSSKNWTGKLKSSFQMMGNLSLAVELAGYPDVGQTKDFLDRLKGKQIKVTIEEVHP